LRRDRNQACATCGDLRQRGLKCLQLEVTIGAPDAAVERDDQRSLGKQIARGHQLAIGTLQRKFRSDVARLPGALRLAGFDQFTGGALHQLQALPGRFEGELAAGEIGFESIEAILQGHGRSPLGSIWSLYLAHLSVKGYTAK